MPNNSVITRLGTCLLRHDLIHWAASSAFSGLSELPLLAGLPCEDPFCTTNSLWELLACHAYHPCLVVPA